jgi:hypothetical protein
MLITRHGYAKVRGEPKSIDLSPLRVDSHTSHLSISGKTIFPEMRRVIPPRSSPAMASVWHLTWTQSPLIKVRDELNRRKAMSSTGLEVLDTTLQKAHEWLNEIMAALGEDDRQALQAVCKPRHAAALAA